MRQALCFFRPVTAWPTSTAMSAMKNMADAMTLICAGMPRRAEPQTNIGKVLTSPELKLVMMKSSNDSEKASSAPAAIPGATSGSVMRRKVCHSSA